jgi:hypothetical protein
MTTLLCCVSVMLMVVVIVLERRVRALEASHPYRVQTIIPCATLILPSKWHTLFRIPSDFTGVGTVSLSSTCTSTDYTNVHISLHGTGQDPITVLEGTHVMEFELDDIVEFTVDHSDSGNCISLRLDLSNPGLHIHMSDIVVTLSIV